MTDKYTKGIAEVFKRDKDQVSVRKEAQEITDKVNMAIMEMYEYQNIPEVIFPVILQHLITHRK